MNIKRAYIAILAMMILPGLALAQGTLPTPVPGTALIVVNKLFDDGPGHRGLDNDETDVTLHFWCSAGTWSPTSVTVTPVFGPYEQVFTVENLPADGPNVECRVTETEPAGYTPEYDCDWGKSGQNFDPDSSCDIPFKGDVPDDNVACIYNDVEARPFPVVPVQGGGNNGGSGGDREGDYATRCVITNKPTPVPVVITKTWEEHGDGGDYYDRDIDITLKCDARIVGGSFNHSDKTWRKTTSLSDNNSYPYNYDDKLGDNVDMAVIKNKVIPDWYPTVPVTDPPTKQPTSVCWATESGQDSAVETKSTCGSTEATAGMKVSLGSGDSCEMINTVFFEGIPTLNQYGMAIMALLMLGLGFVGFRRFV